MPRKEQLKQYLFITNKKVMTPLEEIACKCLQKEISGVFINRDGKKLRLHSVEDRLWVFLEEKTDVIYYVNDINHFTSVFIPDEKSLTPKFPPCPFPRWADGKEHLTLIPTTSKEYSEAFQALAQLLIHRNNWLKDWRPDYSKGPYALVYDPKKLDIYPMPMAVSRPLLFPDYQTAKEFECRYSYLLKKARFLL